MKKTEEGVRKIVVRFNPQSSAIDGVILAKLDACHVPPTHMLKMLLVNHFAQQRGGLGLSDDEQAAFAELSPRFGRKAPVAKTIKDPPSIPSMKHADATPKKLGAEDKPQEVGKAQSAGVVPGSGKPPWGPDNLPPCLDMSDFKDFGTQPGQIVNGKDYQ